MYITAQGRHLRNDLYCVEWDVKLYYTIPYCNLALTTVCCTYDHGYNVTDALEMSDDDDDGGCGVTEGGVDS